MSPRKKRIKSAVLVQSNWSFAVRSMMHRFGIVRFGIVSVFYEQFQDFERYKLSWVCMKLTRSLKSFLLELKAPALGILSTCVMIRAYKLTSMRLK